ncbi:MAG: GspE/PulE family protein [Minisyncoccia bacterium]
MEINNENLKNILLERGYVSLEDLKKAEKFAKSQKISILDYLLEKKLIKEYLAGEIVVEDILLRKKYITTDDIKQAEKFSISNNVSIIEYLLIKGLINNNILGEAISEWFGVPYFDLASNPATTENVLRIPEDIARKYRAIFVKEDEKNVIVTTDMPKVLNIHISVFEKFFGKKNIKLNYSLSEDIDKSFKNYNRSLKARFIEIINSGRGIAPEIIEEIFNDALEYLSSDIHFEPQENEVIVRFRIDGILQEVGRFAKKYYENVLNRIKVQAYLRTDEHFSAQDGAIRYVKNNVTINMRVSILPTLDGEKIAVRILSENIRSFSLGDIGLSTDHQAIIMEASKKPFGMMVVTGPTGSGKTTTVYSILKVLNNSGVNITTIEDPVEYKIPGVNQVQVNPLTNLTFAKGLQSIVRQDPNIILVGEIRDEDTAQIAVGAALTGHLLLSTFHSNDAATAIPRFTDMGISPFLLASTLELIISQRLVQKICDNCRTSDELKNYDIKKFFTDEYLEKEMKLYKGAGCKHCNNTGYRGRTALFEFIHITSEMHDLILKNPSAKQIWDLAKSQGAKSLFQDGLEKVKAGITTLDELLRVASPIHTQNIYDKK